MFVRVDCADQVVTLEEPRDCGRFQVEVVGQGDAAVVDDLLRAQAVGSLVVDDPTHAWIGVQAIRRMAAGQVREDWERSFEGMLGYAESKGWLDAEGTHIRAHLEPRA